MPKNKLEGVRPFNGCYFRSCFYHQLIAGMGRFGLPADNVLLTAFPVIGENFEARDRILSPETVRKCSGCRTKEILLTKDRLIKSIDAGHPVIVGVDCFYLEGRTDTYQKTHLTHFLLVYGYDTENDIVNAVDHSYVNSYKYTEKEVNLSNLLEANQRFPNEKRNSVVLVRRRFFRGGARKILRRIGERGMKENRENSLANLQQLKRLIAEDVSSLTSKAAMITDYLQKMKDFYQCFSRAELIAGRPEIKETVADLAAAYSNMLSLFWRAAEQNNYAFSDKIKESILRKIDAVAANEEQFYGFMEEQVK